MEGEAKGKSQRPEDAVLACTKGAGEDEEEQMEKFFALLKNVREMRKQQRRVGGDRPTKRPKVAGPPWTPTFQREDFREVADLAKSPVAILGTSEVGQEGRKKKEEEETSLALKLAL